MRVLSRTGRAARRARHARDVQGHRHDRRPRAESGDGLGVCRSAPEVLARHALIKGIDTHEDARLAVEHGFDGILRVQSRRPRDGNRFASTLEALPEVVAEVGNRIPVFVDGGFRRGTDVFKALALGAKAVGIGRPFLWGLGAFGQAGRRSRARDPARRAEARDG